MKRMLLFSLLACSLSAQGPTAAPPLIQIFSKPGDSAGPTRAYAGKAAIDVIGLSAATGLPQTWMVELHEKFASVEDLDKAISSTHFRQTNDAEGQTQEDLVGPPRSMIAIYEPGWSYRPDEGARMLPKARWMRVTIHRVRVGLESDFRDLMRLRRATNESVNLDRPELAYRVISGAPSGTYLVLAPVTSLRVFDEGRADLPAFAEPLADARAKSGPKVADVVLGQENLLFRIDPHMSYVSDDFASVDQAFWRGNNAGQ